MNKRLVSDCKPICYYMNNYLGGLLWNSSGTRTVHNCEQQYCSLWQKNKKKLRSLANIKLQLESVFFLTQCLWLVLLLWCYSQDIETIWHVFLINMLNKLCFYVLMLHSAHHNGSANFDIQGRIEKKTCQHEWDKAGSKLKSWLIINHLCTTVQCSNAFQHLSLLEKEHFFLPVFHNLWIAPCFN